MGSMLSNLIECLRGESTPTSKYGVKSSGDELLYDSESPVIEVKISGKAELQPAECKPDNCSRPSYLCYFCIEGVE